MNNNYENIGVAVSYVEDYTLLTVLGTLATQVRLYSFNEKETVKMCHAALHLHRVLNSVEFKEFVLNFKHYKIVTTGRLWWKKKRKVEIEGFHFHRAIDKMSNQEVYNLIMDGRETLQPTTAKVANIRIKLDKRNKRGVLGYTYANSMYQWIYNWFFRSGDTGDVAGNTGHEWFHKLGFGHTYRYNFLRQFSVNYALGYFIRDADVDNLTML